jgi:hypothetical protein
LTATADPLVGRQTIQSSCASIPNDPPLPTARYPGTNIGFCLIEGEYCDELGELYVCPYGYQRYEYKIQNLRIDAKMEDVKGLKEINIVR